MMDKNKIFSCWLLVLLAGIFFNNDAVAQDDSDYFGDSFEIDQAVPRKSTKIRSGSQWLPSTYKDQAALIEKRVTASIKRKLDYRFETGANFSSGSFAPFWFTSNRQGASSIEKSSGYIRMSTIGGMYLPSDFFVDYGMDVSLNANYQSDYSIRQLYVNLGYKWFDVSLGTKERWSELKNKDLSTGGLTWSGNSLPIPQLRIEIPDYVRLNWFGQWFSLKGHIAYGRFTDSDWREDMAAKVSPDKPQYSDRILYHSKAAFLKIGDVSRFPLEVIWGLEMSSQFGGTKHNMVSDGVFYDNYDLPSDVGAYWEVLIPFNPIGKQGDENGNNLGSWHLSFDLTLDKWKARAYYEHFFEDHSSMLGIEYKNNLQGDDKQFVFYGFRRNWMDGLFGLELTAPDGLPFKNIVLEFMNTKGQCGSICNFPNSAISEEVSGRDAMYNHSVYQSYQHWGFACGNPVLISPVYNENGSLSFVSNRTMMFHLGVNGWITNKIDYRLLATHTGHWGTYESPLKEVDRITSVMLECNYRFGDAYSWKIGLAGAMDFDSGNMIGDNKGIMLTLSKVWDVL